MGGELRSPGLLRQTWRILRREIDWWLVAGAAEVGVATALVLLAVWFFGFMMGATNGGR